MPVAQPDTNEFLLRLNTLRADGGLLTNPDEIARLEKSIAAIKAVKNGQPPSSVQVGHYWITLASLRCLTGDFEQVISLGEKGLALTKEPVSIMNHLVTLTVAGFFSKARKLLTELNDEEIANWNPIENLPKIVINCQSYGLKGAAMDTLFERFPNATEKITEARQILAKHKLPEEQVVAMLDLAGEMMRKKKVFLAKDLALHTYPSDASMTISLPVQLPPSEVVQLEWEFLGEVIRKYPDVPYSSFSIGFSCVH